MSKDIAKRLEEYTIATIKTRSPEVLLVHLEIDGEPDQVIVFKGFSSSLSRPTDPDPDVPVIPEHAHIISIDRLQAPYSPTQPRYIEQGLTWEALLDKFPNP